MRNIRVINDDWLFTKENAGVPTALPIEWESKTLPFTWNEKDGQDGGNDYYRGKCWFAKSLKKSDFPEGEVYYLQFDGVNSSAEIYFNGIKVAEHHGGYSTFRAKINDIQDDNLLVVAVDNTANDRVYPQMADFTFYGGIYRDVSIIAVQKKHFDLDYYGSPGMQVTPEIHGNDAIVKVKAFCDGKVRFDIIDNGEVILTAFAEDDEHPEAELRIKNVHLWHGTTDPYLYTMKATLLDGDNEVDCISTRFGCRSFKVDPEKGFILNGKEYPLRGVSRHQDRPGIGNALLPEHHKEDLELIREVGANTIRLAHYQHSQVFYDLCDEYGMVIWAEIPYISRHMPNGYDNTKTQMKELVAQNYNHASIFFWGLSNEISIGGAADESLIKNHKMLNELCHEMDKTRLTTIAAVSVCAMDEEYIHISDVVSYNHYFGWYGGTTEMNGPWFDEFHAKYPKLPIGLSEYGCEALNWHTSTPMQGDYTEEYQAFYHEELIKQIADRPYLWATHVWNMFDFAADARSEGGEDGMNHKGLVTFDRQYRKDSFYAYKAWLNPEPMVHICSKRYVDRVEDVTKVTVYSNCEEVELFANGVSVGKQKKGKYPFFYFEVKNEGETTLKAVAGALCDESSIRKVDTPNDAYILKEEGDVINWFDITTVDGYLSINDTIGEIASTAKGKMALISVVLMLVKKMKSSKKEGGGGGEVAGFSLSGVKISKSMISGLWKMLSGFSIKRASSMAKGLFTRDDLLSINAKLNKIKKK